MTTRIRRTWRLLALAVPAALAGGAVPNAARADASLQGAGGEEDLHEPDHRLAVRFAGTLAIVRAEQTLANRAGRALEAIYTFELPSGAVVQELSVRLADGRVAAATVVDATAAVTPTVAAEGLKAAPDVALLRLVDADDRVATYELRLYPVDAGRAVTVRMTWLAPLRYDGGRLSLRIPGRGPAANLVRERVTLALEPPPGARGFGAVHAGGLALPAGRRELIAPADGDLVIEAVPLFPAGAPPLLVSYATAAIDDQQGAIALSLLAAPGAALGLPDFERAVLVIDTSRSMGETGQAAAAELADAALDALGPGTQIEVILFDRRARRVLGGWRASAGARAQVRAALSAPAATAANGSDLGAALDELRGLLEHRRQLPESSPPTTLVLILSDGMTPLALTAPRALDRLGAPALDAVQIVAVLIGPDDAPAPDSTNGPLPVLARRSGGRAVAVRAGELRGQAAALAAELTGPPPLENLQLTGGEPGLVSLAVPPRLDAGGGALVIGRYRGAAPVPVVTFARAGREVVATGRRQTGALARAVAPLWLRSAALEDLIPDDDRIDPGAAGTLAYDDATLSRARQLAVDRARRHAVVGPYSALVAVDPRDAFARDRQAFAARWGAAFFSRVPPPPEREPGHVVREAHLAGTAAGVEVPSTSGAAAGDLDSEIVQRLLRQHVVPLAKACFDRALRGQPDLRGSLVVVLEIARGEVQLARVERSTLPAGSLEACVVDAAYTVPVPRVALGDDLETIGVVRYPLSFAVVDRAPDVRPGDYPRYDPEGDVADPLGGLPKQPR